MLLLMAAGCAAPQAEAVAAVLGTMAVAPFAGSGKGRREGDGPAPGDADAR
jgi:hypothetical protein